MKEAASGSVDKAVGSMRHQEATPTSVLPGPRTHARKLVFPSASVSLALGKTDLPRMLSAFAAFSLLGLGAATSDQSQDLRGPMGGTALVSSW